MASSGWVWMTLILMLCGSRVSAEPLRADSLSTGLLQDIRWTPEKARVGVDMGVSVLSDIGNIAYVRPTIVKQVSPRLAVAAAVRYTRCDLKPLPWMVYDAQHDQQSVQLSVAGIYKINDKWKVWGAVSRQMTNREEGCPFAGPYESYTIGALYHPNPSTWLRAELNYTRASYFGNPFLAYAYPAGGYPGNFWMRPYTGLFNDPFSAF